jgi:hypothetical protein
MRGVMVGEHACGLEECPGGKCPYNGDYDIIIAWDPTITVCSTLQPDLTIIQVFVCTMSQRVAMHLVDFEKFWDKAEYSGPGHFRWRFTFEAMDAQEVVSLLKSWFHGLEMTNYNGH